MKKIREKKFRSISSSIIGVFIVLLAITIGSLVFFSAITTKGKMYAQMTTQGVQLGTQIRADLESDEAVFNAEALTTIGDNQRISDILAYLGTDESIIYTGILDDKNEVIAHSDPSRIGNVYDGTFENPLVQQNKVSASMYFDVESGNNALSLVLPIRNGSGSLIGTLALGYSIDAVDTAIKEMIYQSIAIGVIAFIIATIILKLFLNRLLRPIKQLTITAERASNGDFNQQIENVDHNEVGRLTKSFNIMIGDLKSIIDNIVMGIEDANTSSSALNDIANESKKVSDHLFDIMNGVSEGANQQMLQTKNVKSNMDQMTYNLNLILKELDQFKSVMLEMNAISKQSESDMVVMDQQIERISNTSQSSGETVKELIKASEEIGKIVDLIDKIAKQTNLIALNAAIEAASAGVHGRGFSIVAEEIRILANESLKAVEDIAKIVKETQNKRGDTLQSIEKTLEQSRKGREVSDRVKHSFTQIHESIERANQQFVILESSSNQLVERSKDVSCSIESINVISEEVVSNTKEAIQWTEQQNQSTRDVLENVTKLKGLSTTMRAMVSKFKKSE